MAETLHPYLNQCTLHPSTPLPETLNLGVIIPPTKDQPTKATACLTPSKAHIVNK
ncbi:hypothetical protein CROQUDRAFT_658519 [Cronartium quercuum f. sp. fusiforme G11]|uniref:Uncharacterized protein n=1 Tax=Cronartium quercuum f. sp. fusiforme G11 TaxID=708437 RepID=A0A9P6TCF7_9BASI|nr:hypothetical protein CROQUDRAFT_658519 [Cronartium quercuum f. sp. fusiforme G11]